MNKLSIGYKLLAVLCAVGSIDACLAQGSLTPPGAPAATMKTLEQVEPRIDVATLSGDVSTHINITNSGSYYLSGNLEVTKSTGIFINTTGVTLDLNGFVVSRVSGGGGVGIYIWGAADRATVRNGTLEGFDYGIRSYHTPAYAKGCLFEEVTVTGCTQYGISAGTSSRIVDCRAHDNAGTGIYSKEGSSLTGCTANNNQGSYGIYAGSASTISDCTTYNNLAHGIYTSDGSVIRGCTSKGNQGSYGIYANHNTVIENCIADNNLASFGIRAGSGSSIIGCVANNNYGTGQFSSYGIYVNSVGVIVDCVARANNNTNSSTSASVGVGIGGGYGLTVRNCTVADNRGDGIRISNDSQVEGNTCDGNGNSTGNGAGIHATNSDNRIDANTVIDNDRGIEVDIAGSLIVRNSASGNTTNYVIAAGNDTGTIQTSPVGAGAWDNFEF